MSFLGSLHVAAAVLALVVAAIVLVRTKGTTPHVRLGLVWSPRRRGSRQTHAILMIWSVAGLVGAGLAQGATAALPQATPWPTIAKTAAVCLFAALATRALASDPRPASP